MLTTTPREIENNQAKKINIVANIIARILNRKMKMAPRIEIISSSTLGKKDKKLLNKSLEGMELEQSVEYKMHKCKHKLNIITKDGKPILFTLNGIKYMPTLNALEENSFLGRIAWLDQGALKPILSGANVMSPGIYLYKDRIEKQWIKSDIVAIKIIDKGLVAIGIAEVGSEDVVEKSSGICINIVHRRNDNIYNLRV